MEVEVSIKAILMVPATNSTAILLKEEPGDREVKIWVGAFEAGAITLQIENIEPPRPLTHDLIRDLLRELDARITKVVIHTIRRKTFFAHVHLQRKRERLAVDARPSDAIALALRASAPIYVESRVLEEAARRDNQMHETPGDPPEDADALSDWLRGLDDEDLGAAQ